MRQPGLRIFSPVLMICFTGLVCAQSGAPKGQATPGGEALQGDMLKQLLPGLGQQRTSTFDATEGMLKLDVVVTDSSGKPVTGLRPEDFTLLDNGLPEKVVKFHAFDGATAKPDPPVELILVIDGVNLPGQQVSRVEEEIGRFLRLNGGHLSQPVLIYRLSAGILSVTQGPSTDGNALAEEMVHKIQLREVWAHSPDQYVDATQLSRAVSSFYRNETSLAALGAMTLEERRRPGRKLMVWLSGGWPVLQGSDIDSFDWVTEFSTRLREARISLSSVTCWPYPVRGFPYQFFMQGTRPARRVNTDYLIQSMALEVLATQSGGRVVEPEADMAAQIKGLVEQANAFYTLSFDPPRTDQVDEYHDLKVQVSKPGLEARTNNGYYDQPSYYDQQTRTTERVTVDQLEQRLAAVRERSDSAMADELSGLELTERISSTQLADLKARLRGTKASAALVALADASTFLNPPEAKVIDTAMPTMAAQREMLAKTIDYLSNTIPKLPNFFATRSTVRYRETSQKDSVVWKTTTGDQMVHDKAISTATVLYRDGFDVVDAEAVKGKKAKKERSMETRGTFGPILSTVILDVSHGGDLRWSRWEQGAGGVRAVFRYVVPKEKSHYELTYCCLTEGDGTTIFKLKPGYHGELMIDTDSGAILRLTVEADLEPMMPLMLSNIMVQYGPETIGGNTYICPARSVSLWRGRRSVQVHEWGESFRVYGPFETMLDDVSFGDYHMFRGEARVLTGFDESTDGKPSDSGKGGGATPAPKN